MHLTRQNAPATILLAAPFAMAMALAHWFGGYYIGSWGLAALALWTLVGILLWSGLLAVRTMPRLTRCAFGLLGAYGLWTLASTLWASNQHAAMEEALRVGMYLAALTVGYGMSRSHCNARAALAIYVLGAAVVTATMLPTMARDTEHLLLDGRLIGIVGYHNGQAAFALVPFWIGIALASHPQCGWALRGALVGSLALLTQIAVLTQSRGAALSLVLAGILYLCCTPRRLRALVAGTIALAPVAAGWSTLNAVYVASGRGQSHLESALHDAAIFIAASSLACAAAAAVWALADRRVSISPRIGRVVGAISFAAIAIGVIGAGGVWVHAYGNPVTRLHATWTHLDDPAPESRGTTRFLRIGSASTAARLVLWKVALRDVRHHPVRGVGAANYAATFYRYRPRAIDRYVRQPHNLTLEALSERGVIGGALWTLFMLVVAASAVIARWGGGRDRDDRALAVGIACSGAAWLAHSQIDWLWQLPAVTIPVFLSTGILLGATARPARESASPELGARRWLRAPALAACAVASLCTFVPWLADRYVQRSNDLAATAPAAADRAARAAVTLTPRSPGAVRAAARRAEARGDLDRAARLTRRQIDLDDAHYVSYQIAASYFERQGPARAAASMRAEALRRNPLEPALRDRQ